MERKLQDIGLSKNESKIYLALTELGNSSVKQLSEITGIHRSNIYENLQKLAEKGLVSAIMRDGKKYYTPNRPDSLFNLLNHKRNVLQQILPDLNKLHEKLPEGTEHSVEVHQGKLGLKHITNLMIQVGEPIYAFGVPTIASDVMKYFLSNFHEERIRRKIPIFDIFDEDSANRLDYLNSLPYTQAKVMRGSAKSPATTSIFGDYVTIWVWSQPEFLLLIKSKSVAKAYKQHFDILWTTINT